MWVWCCVGTREKFEREREIGRSPRSNAKVYSLHFSRIELDCLLLLLVPCVGTRFVLAHVIPLTVGICAPDMVLYLVTLNLNLWFSAAWLV